MAEPIAYITGEHVGGSRKEGVYEILAEGDMGQRLDKATIGAAFVRAEVQAMADRLKLQGYDPVCDFILCGKAVTVS